MKRSQARKREASAPAPKKGFAKLIKLFVRPRNDVREAAKKLTKPQPPRPMPTPFVLRARPPSVAGEPEPASDPILRSVLSALTPDPDERAPEVLRERLLAWAEATAADPLPDELDGVLEALAPRVGAPAALREKLAAWAEQTSEPRAPAELDAPAPEAPSLWGKLRRLARALLERLRKASRGAS